LVNGWTNGPSCIRLKCHLSMPDPKPRVTGRDGKSTILNLATMGFSSSREHGTIYLNPGMLRTTPAHEILGHWYLATKGVTTQHEWPLSAEDRVPTQGGSMFTGPDVMKWIKQNVEWK